MSDGRFVKGKSGNPGGRPKAVMDVIAAARLHGPSAIETLAEIMIDKNAPPAARALAANSILDRGWGKPTQPIVAEVSAEIVDARDQVARQITRLATERAESGDPAEPHSRAMH